MKRPGKLIVMGLCLAALLCLAACSAEPPEATVEPTIPVAEALYAYNAACIRLDTAKNLRIRADITRQRQLGSDHYTEAESYNAAYSSPGASSMDAMVELTLGYGEFTLRYCFSEFLRGDQIDLRGHIMALACEEIMLLWGEAYTIDSVPFTGQDRFDAFRKNAESLADQFSPEDLEKSFPGAFLLLQMSSDRG